ncbi:MAG: hypothetical protein ACMG6E_08780 [Candidatus Roizmanbacteria bacterium]
MSTGDFTWDVIGINVLNNIGYMYTDVVNVVTSNSTTQTNYPYFLAYNIGDFIIRWFWSSDNNTHSVPGTPR